MQRTTLSHFVSVMLASSFQLLALAQGEERPMEHPTSYRTTKVDCADSRFEDFGKLKA